MNANDGGPGLIPLLEEILGSRGGVLGCIEQYNEERGLKIDVESFGAGYPGNLTHLAKLPFGGLARGPEHVRELHIVSQLIALRKERKRLQNEAQTNQEFGGNIQKTIALLSTGEDIPEILLEGGLFLH